MWKGCGSIWILETIPPNNSKIKNKINEWINIRIKMKVVET